MLRELMDAAKLGGKHQSHHPPGCAYTCRSKCASLLTVAENECRQDTRYGNKSQDCTLCVDKPQYMQVVPR